MDLEYTSVKDVVVDCQVGTGGGGKSPTRLPSVEGLWICVGHPRRIAPRHQISVAFHFSSQNKINDNSSEKVYRL